MPIQPAVAEGRVDKAAVQANGVNGVKFAWGLGVPISQVFQRF